MFNKIIAPLFVFVAAFAAPAIASAQEAAGSASGSNPSILAVAMAVAIGLAGGEGGSVDGELGVVVHQVRELLVVCGAHRAASVAGWWRRRFGAASP